MNTAGLIALALLAAAALAVTLWPRSPASPRAREARESLRIAVAAEAERRRLPPSCSDALNSEFQRCADLMDLGILSWGYSFEYLATWINGRAPRKASAVDARADAIDQQQREAMKAIGVEP